MDPRNGTETKWPCLALDETNGSILDAASSFPRCSPFCARWTASMLPYLRRRYMQKNSNAAMAARHPKIPPAMAPTGARLRDGDEFPVSPGEAEVGEAGECVSVDDVVEEEVVVDVLSKLKKKPICMQYDECVYNNSRVYGVVKSYIRTACTHLSLYFQGVLHVIQGGAVVHHYIVQILRTSSRSMDKISSQITVESERHVGKCSGVRYRVGHDAEYVDGLGAQP
jgi:hypothetical protein